MHTITAAIDSSLKALQQRKDVVVVAAPGLRISSATPTWSYRYGGSDQMG
jgi:hypothetical protein